MHDVIVIGAGPAGSATAYNLASRGAKTLIIERERLPRYKPCGGGVNVHSARLLPFDISPVVERTIHSYEIGCRFGETYVRTYPEPVTYMTMRDRFDTFLAEKAQSVGAGLLQTAPVTSIEELDDRVRVTARGEVFEARYVVGADGATGISARALGDAARYWRGVAIELEIVPDDPAVHDRFDRLVSVDLGSIPGGYGWVFPKGDHLSVGAGGPRRQTKRLQAYLEKFLASRGLTAHRLVLKRGYTLPMRKGGCALQTRRVLLAGDAGGLIDPATGDGIYSAIKSGIIAAEVLVGALGGTGGPQEYARRVNRELLRDLQAAAMLVKLFNLAPGLFVARARTSDSLWFYLCQVLRGERSYFGLHARLGLLRHTFPLALRWNTLGW